MLFILFSWKIQTRMGKAAWKKNRKKIFFLCKLFCTINFILRKKYLKRKFLHMLCVKIFLWNLFTEEKIRQQISPWDEKKNMWYTLMNILSYTYNAHRKNKRDEIFSFIIMRRLFLLHFKIKFINNLHCKSLSSWDV